MTILADEYNKWNKIGTGEFNLCNKNGDYHIENNSCTCDPGYYFSDCSVSEIQYVTYLSVKKNIFDYMNSFKGNITNDELKGQFVKLMNELLEDGDISIIMRPDQINNQLDDLGNLLSNQDSVALRLKNSG